MFDRLSNDEIATALVELISCLGVKEEVASDDLVDVLLKRGAEACAQELAARFGLPIRIRLSYVPNGFRRGNTNRFHSSALAQTDGTGRGTEGITAQVSIPQHLPMFGTSSLQGFPMQILVSENCREWPDTFVKIMAHELSHVLLASLRSTHENSELHADLVPIVLGFSGVVRKGIKTIESTTSDNTTTTQTITYGYLTDSQIEFACNYVAELLNRYSHNKERLFEVVERVQLKLRKATRSLATFRDYFKYLDIHPPERMSKEHADRVVQLHGQDYSLECESRIKAVKKSVEIAEAFARPLNHYWTNTVKHLKAHLRVLELASRELDQVTGAIAKDEKIFRKYIGFIYRLRRTMSSY